MGIRGTKILANVNIDKENKNISQFALLKGKAEIMDHLLSKKHSIKPGEHYISISDPSLKGEVEQSIKELDRETFKKLLAEDLDEEKDFYPLLDFYFEDNKVSRDPSSINIERVEHIEKHGPTKYFDRQNKKNWANSLKKLNETLDDYNSYE